LVKERSDLQVKTQGVVSLGRGMSEDKLLDRKKEQNFMNRIDRLEQRMTSMMDWPFGEQTR
jgi:hypothetical protein